MVVPTCPRALTVRTWPGRFGRKMSQRPQRRATAVAAAVWAALVPGARRTGAEARVEQAQPQALPPPLADPPAPQPQALPPPLAAPPAPQQQALPPPLTTALTTDTVEELQARAAERLRALAVRRQIVVYASPLDLVEPYLSGTMHERQKEAVAHAIDCLSGRRDPSCTACVLDLVMGIGKTLIALAGSLSSLRG